MTHKVLLITGASSGFGRLAAQRAAEQGYRVVVTARRAEKLDELVREVEAAGGAILSVPGDITDEQHQQHLLDAALERFGQLDVLVNNAGIPLPGSFADTPLDDLRQQWQTNVMSIVTLTKRALPALMKSKGVVINIGSTAGRFSLPIWGMYFPTKVAVASISDTLRRELRPYGVRVALVEPGPYDTEFMSRTGNADGGGLPADQVARAIVRLAEHPRRTTVVPWWMRPLVSLGSAIMHVLPDVVDVIWWALAKRQLRKQEQSSGMAASAASDS